MTQRHELERCSACRPIDGGSTRGVAEDRQVPTGDDRHKQHACSDGQPSLPAAISGRGHRAAEKRRTRNAGAGRSRCAPLLLTMTALRRLISPFEWKVKRLLGWPLLLAIGSLDRFDSKRRHLRRRPWGSGSSFVDGDCVPFDSRVGASLDGGTGGSENPPLLRF